MFVSTARTLLAVSSGLAEIDFDCETDTLKNGVAAALYDNLWLMHRQ